MADKKLATELKEHISSLEKVLEQVSSTKSNLAQNAHQAKYRIQLVMSRQLEALRRREVWLLQQVELIADTKDSVLRQQAESLHSALGALQACCNCLEAEDTSNLETKIKETMENLEKLNTQPLESPHLSFKADLTQFKDAVHKFGKVDANSLPLDMVFAEPGVATSLPQAFEEYDDDDAHHHLMVKNFQDVQTTDNCTQRFVNFCPPGRMAVKPSDWLFLPSDVQPPTPVKKLTFPPFQSEDLSQWLVGASKASVQQWLQDLQVQGDLEEDAVATSPLDAFVGDSSCGDPSIEVLSLPRSTWSEVDVPITPPQPQPTSCPFPYFMQIAGSPHETWLKDQKDVSKSSVYENMDCFKNVPNSTKAWLQEIQNEPEESPMAVCCGGTSCSTLPVAGSFEIEDLSDMPCTTNKIVDSEKDVDEQEAAVAQGIKKLCKANEPCNTFSDCLCEDNCGKKEISPAAKSWLLQPKNEQMMKDLKEAPIFKYFEMVTSADASAWLAQSDPQKAVQMEQPFGRLFSPFSDSTSMSHWLLGSLSASEAASASVQTCPVMKRFTDVKADSDEQWIHSDETKISNPREEITSGAFQFRHNGSDIEMWLSHAAPPASPPPQPKINPWLLNSPTTSPNHSVQCLSSERLFEKLNNVETTYSWNITATQPKKGVDKPIPKKNELPECDNKLKEEEGNWLMVSKEDGNKADGLDIRAEKQNMHDNVQLLQGIVKDKEAIGEWLMSIQSNFE